MYELLLHFALLFSIDQNVFHIEQFFSSLAVHWLFSLKKTLIEIEDKKKQHRHRNDRYYNHPKMIFFCSCFFWQRKTTIINCEQFTNTKLHILLDVNEWKKNICHNCSTLKIPRNFFFSLNRDKVFVFSWQPFTWWFGHFSVLAMFQLLYTSSIGIMVTKKTTFNENNLFNSTARISGFRCNTETENIELHPKMWCRVYAVDQTRLYKQIIILMTQTWDNAILSLRVFLSEWIPFRSSSLSTLSFSCSFFINSSRNF